jgi:hypothetical protein
MGPNETDVGIFLHSTRRAPELSEEYINELVRSDSQLPDNGAVSC